LKNIYRTEHVQHRQLTLRLPQFSGGPFRPWGSKTWAYTAYW